MKAKIIMNEIKRDGDVLNGISVGRYGVMRAYSHAIETYPRQFTDIRSDKCIFSHFNEDIENSWVMRHLHLAAKELDCDVNDLLWVGLSNTRSIDMHDDVYEEIVEYKNDMKRWLKPQFLGGECINIQVTEERNPEFTNESYALIVNLNIRAVKAVNRWERTDNHVSFATANYYVQYR